MPQSVKRPTPDFGSGRDLAVRGTDPHVGSELSLEPAWDSLPLSLGPSHSLVLSLSLLKFFFLNKEK